MNYGVFLALVLAFTFSPLSNANETMEKTKGSKNTKKETPRDTSSDPEPLPAEKDPDAPNKDWEPAPAPQLIDD